MNRILFWATLRGKRLVAGGLQDGAEGRGG